jgi:hypothetical protein
MKLISIKVSDKAYSQFKDYAGHRGRAVAELIREAMDFYIDNKIRPVTTLKRMPTTSKPKLKRRWSKEQVQEEMLG